jgi:hypothetical protein
MSRPLESVVSIRDRGTKAEDLRWNPPRRHPLTQRARGGARLYRDAWLNPAEMAPADSADPGQWASSLNMELLQASISAAPTPEPAPMAGSGSGARSVSVSGADAVELVGGAATVCTFQSQCRPLQRRVSRRFLINDSFRRCRGSRLEWPCVTDAERGFGRAARMEQSAIGMSSCEAISCPTRSLNQRGLSRRASSQILGVLAI